MLKSFLGTGKFNARGNPLINWLPIQGGIEILLRLVLQKPELSAGLKGHLAHEQTFHQTRERLIRCHCIVDSTDGMSASIS